jgi:CubicO group peptidase (beta-lactamase class C family)
MDEPISTYLSQRIDAGDFPSAVYLVGLGHEILVSGALGNSVTEPEIGATVDTIYDLASVTKPVIIGLLTALFVQRGMISLDHKVSAHIGEFDTAGKRMITIRDLVCHTSHLPAWVPFYLLTDQPSEIMRVIADLDLEYGPENVVYGDPNFIVLGVLLERLSGMSLGELAQTEIFAPLKLKNTYFNPPLGLKEHIAANEFGNEFEHRMCMEKGYERVEDYAFRTDMVWGEVHDGNAYFMNGIAGHAGLFSTASDLFAIAKQFLAATSVLLSPESCSLFTENFTPGGNEERSLAFQLASTSSSTAGARLAPESFGHLGFTGTSLWIDPILQRIYILLTNRTHRRALPFPNINSVRREFHELAANV